MVLVDFAPGMGLNLRPAGADFVFTESLEQWDGLSSTPGGNFFG